jgi:hypothetical protein
MRVCPKCGYEDPPIWRNTLRRLYTDHCHIEDLKIWEPQLAQLILEKKYVCLNGVKYKLNRKGSHVHRIMAKHCKYPDVANPSIMEPDTEKSKARLLGRQRFQKELILEAEK